MNKTPILLLTLAVGLLSPAAAARQVPVELIAYDACYWDQWTYTLHCSISVAQVDGTGGLPLPVDGTEPAWSPDGRRIAFSIRWGSGVAVWDAGTITRLNGADGGASPTWAPDGQRIAFRSSRTGSGELYAWQADGSVTQLTHQAGAVGSSAWSPDGARIAFDCVIVPGNVDVCALELATGAVTRLTTDSAWDAGPAWSPDGTRLAFATARFAGVWEIALMNPDGSEVSRIGSGIQGVAPAWSPGGNRIAYETAGGPCDDFGFCLHVIYLVNVDGTGQTFLGYGSNPSWAPTAILGRPYASMSYSCVRLACSFSGLNSWDEDGQIQSYTWIFGDGGSGTGGTIDHTFPAAGTYLVTLKVVDNEGHDGTSTRAITVVVPPVAVATVSCSGMTCTFDGSGSFDPDGTIVDYTWNFGDGGDGVQASGPVVSHTYATGNNWPIWLWVKDNSGGSALSYYSALVMEPLHVGDLDGSAAGRRNNWVAGVTITVHDGNHQPVANVTVNGTWTSGGPGVCTTNTVGQCTLSRQTSGAAVTFTVGSLESSSYRVYLAGANHDPDGESNGTSIRIQWK